MTLNLRVIALQFGQSLASNIFGIVLLQLIVWRLKRPFICSFSYMVFLINHVTCLNNAHE